jgi:amino acid transporter
MHVILAPFMRKTSHILSLILTLFLLSLASEKSLMAYADPGSGAMFVQIILAAMIGVLFRIRKIINRFRRPKNGPESQNIPSLGENGPTV